MIRFETAAFEQSLERPYGRLFSGEGFERTDERVRWTFTTGHGLGRIGLARDAELSDEIIGVMALTPNKVWCRGEVLSGWHAFDLVVDPKYRGRGVFSGIARKSFEDLADAGADFAWGAPNANSAHGFFKRFGWEKVRPVPMMVRPLRSGFFLRRIAGFLGRFDFRLPTSSNDAERRAISEFGPEADRLWQRFASRIDCAVVRDAGWLNWRLFRRPDAEYRTTASFGEDGELRCFVSTRLSNEHGGKILQIMEAISGSKKDDPLLAKLLQNILAEAAADGADAATCWCPPNAPQYAAYRRAGFFPLPTWIRPATFYFGVMPLRENLPAEVTSSDAWYMSYLDLDTL